MFAIVVVLVLLILTVACANLGGLLLARGAARQREIGLRVALGAGRLRLVRQLLTESLVLAFLGAGSGLVLGVVVMKAVLVWTEAPPWIDSTPDWRVVTFAFGIGGTSALLFGLSPALHVARQRTGRSRGRSVMIAGQVAASCVLLIVAGLLVRAFDRAASQDPGFDYRHTVLIEPSLLQHGYRPARARLYLAELEQRLRALPGVESVALATTPPLGGGRVTVALPVHGRAARGGSSTGSIPRSSRPCGFRCCAGAACARRSPQGSWSASRWRADAGRARTRSEGRSSWTARRR